MSLSPHSAFWGFLMCYLVAFHQTLGPQDTHSRFNIGDTEAGLEVTCMKSALSKLSPVMAQCCVSQSPAEPS